MQKIDPLSLLRERSNSSQNLLSILLYIANESSLIFSNSSLSFYANFRLFFLPSLVYIGPKLVRRRSLLFAIFLRIMISSSGKVLSSSLKISISNLLEISKIISRLSLISTFNTTLSPTKQLSNSLDKYVSFRSRLSFKVLYFSF